MSEGFNCATDVLQLYNSFVILIIIILVFVFSVISAELQLCTVAPRGPRLSQALLTSTLMN